MYWIRTTAALLLAWLALSAPARATSLQFFGNGTADIDRVKIRIDDGTSAPETVPRPADIGDTDFTIEFWIKGSAADNTGAVICNGYNWITGNVVIDRDRFSQGRGYGISLGSGRIAFGVINRDNNTGTVCSSVSVLDGQWHHVAVQRAVSSGAMTVYVDGTLQGQQASGPTGPISYPDDGTPGGSCSGGPCVNSDPFLVFGAEKHDAGGTLAFNGFLDEIMLSTVVRYAANFPRPTAPFSPNANTAALYHFDEGTGTVVNDADSADGDQSNGVLSVGGNPSGPVWSSDTPPFGGSAGTLQFTSATATVGEGAGSTPLVVSRAGGSSGAVTVDYATTDGSAGSGDYSTATGTLQWNNGDATNQAFNVTILQDTLMESAESFSVALSAPSGGATLGALSTTTVTITDDDAVPPAGALAFSAATASVNEGAGAVGVTITRTSGSAGAVGVTVATSNGSAVAGSDYTTTNTTENWANGVTTSRTVNIPIADDATVESAETFTVTLSTPTGGATLAAPSTLTVTIVDNDSAPAGTMQFATAAQSVAESATSVGVVVTRAGGTSGAASVQYATSPGTAGAPGDYTAASGTLNWASGDGSDRTITIALSPDTTFEGTESFSVALSNPTGAALGAPNTATVTINDDDSSPPPSNSGNGGGSLNLLALAVLTLLMMRRVTATRWAAAG